MNRSPIKQLIEKEGIAALVFLAVTLLLAIGIEPGIGTSNQASFIGKTAAPWIFGPVQILLFYCPSWFAAIAVPVLMISALSFLPWIDKLLGEKATRRIFTLIIGFTGVLLTWFWIKERGSLQW